VTLLVVIGNGAGGRHLVVLAAAECERDTDEHATEAGGAVAGLGSCCDHY
jgi:hypothetical protein